MRFCARIFEPRLIDLEGNLLREFFVENVLIVSHGDFFELLGLAENFYDLVQLLGFLHVLRQIVNGLRVDVVETGDVS